MKAHLKRLAIPTTWPIPRKSSKYITRPISGNALDSSLPLSIVFRDVLKIANTAKEVKHILLNNYVFVNGIQRKDIKQTIGLLDVLEMKGTGEAYRMVINTKGKFEFVPIKETEVRIRPNKVVGKTLLKNGKVQLNFMNGYNIIVEKDEFKVGDVVVLELPEKKIRETFTLDKDMIVYLLGGSHVGKTGKVVEFDNKNIVVKVGSETYRTDRKYAFIVGKDKPSITLSVE